MPLCAQKQGKVKRSAVGWSNVARKSISLLSVAVIAILLTSLLWGGVGSGTKVVTTAGTRVALAASSTPVVWVTVQAKLSNTGIIYAGGSSVGSSSGVELEAGDSMHFGLAKDGQPYYNLTEIYIDATVNGEGVVFTYATRP